MINAIAFEDKNNEMCVWLSADASYIWFLIDWAAGDAGTTPHFANGSKPHARYQISDER